MAAVNRFYSSNAMRTTIVSTITSTATTVTVGATTGFPASTPFTLVLDEGQVLEEIVTVTAVAGTTLTVVRGVDGTTGVTHSTSASVVHALTARDLREPQEHIAATTAVHGASGSLLDTGSVQAVTGTKNFTAITVASAIALAAGSTVATRTIGQAFTSSTFTFAADQSINVGISTVTGWPNQHIIQAWYFNGLSQRIPMAVVREETTTGLVFLTPNGAGTGTIVSLLVLA